MDSRFAVALAFQNLVSCSSSTAKGSVPTCRMNPRSVTSITFASMTSVSARAVANASEARVHKIHLTER